MKKAFELAHEIKMSADEFYKNISSLNPGRSSAIRPDPQNLAADAAVLRNKLEQVRVILNEFSLSEKPAQDKH